MRLPQIHKVIDAASAVMCTSGRELSLDILLVSAAMHPERSGDENFPAATLEAVGFELSRLSTVCFLYCPSNPEV